MIFQFHRCAAKFYLLIMRSTTAAMRGTRMAKRLTDWVLDKINDWASNAAEAHIEVMEEERNKSNEFSHRR